MNTLEPLSSSAAYYAGLLTSINSAQHTEESLNALVNMSYRPAEHKTAVQEQQFSDPWYFPGSVKETFIWNKTYVWSGGPWGCAVR